MGPKAVLVDSFLTWRLARRFDFDPVHLRVCVWPRRKITQLTQVAHFAQIKSPNAFKRSLSYVVATVEVHATPMSQTTINLHVVVDE